MFGSVRVFYPLLGPFVHWIEEEGKSGRKFTVVLLGKKSTEGKFSKKVGKSGKASASSFYGDLGYPRFITSATAFREFLVQLNPTHGS